MKKIGTSLFVMIFFFISQGQNANEHYIKGMNAFDHKKYNEAIEAFTLALKADSTFKEAFFKRGVCYELMEDYKKAIIDFTSIIIIDKKNTQAYYNRGLAYRELGKFNKAIFDFSSAIKFNPTHKYAYYNRALAKLSLEDYEGACIDLSKSADLGIERAAKIYKYTCTN